MQCLSHGLDEYADLGFPAVMRRADQVLSRDEERALVGRLQAGDPDAFAAIVARYAERLTRFAFYIVGSHDAADDVVQQVWVQLWERRAIVEPDQLTPYLYRAVRNRALNEQSASAVRERFRANVQAEAATGTATAAVPSPEDAVLTIAVVQAAVDRLSDRRRLAIRLRLEEELTHAEIAEILGVSAVAAQRLVARAIADLREILWGV